MLAGGAARGAYEVGIVVHVLEDVARTLGRERSASTSSAAPPSARSTPAASRPRFSRRAIRPTPRRRLDGPRDREARQDDVTGVLKLGARILGRAVPAAEMPAREGGLIESLRPRGARREGDPVRSHRGQPRSRSPRGAHGLDDAHRERQDRRVRRAQRAGPAAVESRSDDRAARAEIGAKSTRSPRRRFAILFRAVNIDGEFHCDGGLRQNVPLSPARRLGADGVLVVNPRFLPTTPLGSDDPIVEDIFPGPLFLARQDLERAPPRSHRHPNLRPREHQPDPRGGDALLTGRASSRG